MTTEVASATESFATRVAERGNDLAPAERRVAESLLELGPQATLLSAAALAEQLGTSDATVVRTAKALGYSGLAELRRALAAYGNEPPLAERLRRTLEQTPGGDLFESTIRNHLTAIDVLTRNVSPVAFQEAVALLAGSDRVVWRGVGPSAHLAGYGQLLTQRIGKPSSALVHTGTSFADELLSIAPGDAIVVFAYGRPQSHVRVLIERAAALETPVVLITDTIGHKLGTAGMTTLQCGRGAPGLFASHGTTLVVIEALVLAMADSDRKASQENLATLNELRAALAGRRIDVDTP
ncbi:MAG TPA: MurR/RpiR family transcriptional regulator [Acidimicrobiia bacterium]|nr:MurR/RpiR family transcriptional regulator [Acidimicrobiia bacterium]